MCSDFTHLFFMPRYDFYATFSKEIHCFIHFMKCKAQTVKLNHGDSDIKANRKMGCQIYEFMCRKFWEREDTEYISENHYLALEWN